MRGVGVGGVLSLCVCVWGGCSHCEGGGYSHCEGGYSQCEGGRTLTVRGVVPWSEGIRRARARDREVVQRGEGGGLGGFVSRKRGGGG